MNILNKPWGRASGDKAGPRHSSRRGGQAIVEFALIVPLLLVILIGIMEFGYLVKNQLQISNATREGARAAALGKTVGVIRARVQNTASPLTVTDGQIVLTSSANDGADNYPYAVTDTTINGVTQNNVAAGRLVRVRTSYPHTSLTGFFPFMNSRTIAIQVTMRREAA